MGINKMEEEISKVNLVEPIDNAPPNPSDPTSRLQLWDNAYNSDKFLDFDYETQIEARDAFFEQEVAPRLQEEGADDKFILSSYDKFNSFYPTRLGSSGMTGMKWDSGLGVAENIFSMGTGLFSLLGGTATGLVDNLLDSDASKSMLSVRKKEDGTYDFEGSIPEHIEGWDAMVYEPRTDAGKKLMDVISRGFNWYSESIVDKYMVDPVDNPYLKTGAKVIGEGLPMAAPLVPKGVKGVKAVRAKTLRKNLLKETENAKNDLYEFNKNNPKQENYWDRPEPVEKIRQEKIDKLNDLESKASTAPFEFEDVATVEERARRKFWNNYAEEPTIVDGKARPIGIYPWQSIFNAKEMADVKPRFKPFYLKATEAVRKQDKLRHRWTKLVDTSNKHLTTSGLSLKKGGQYRARVSWLEDVMGRELEAHEVRNLPELKELTPQQRGGVYRSVNALNRMKKNALVELKAHIRKKGGNPEDLGIEGYTPHFFKEWVVLQKKGEFPVGWLKDEILDRIGAVSYDTPGEAIGALKLLLKNHPELKLSMKDFEIHGRGFEMPQSSTSATIVRDAEFFRQKNIIEKAGRIGVEDYLANIDPHLKGVLSESEFLERPRMGPFEQDPNTGGWTRQGGDRPFVVADQKIRDLLGEYQRGNTKALKEILRLKPRSRQVGSLMHREGYKGFETDLGYSIPRYINQISRYMAMDDFKSWSESAYQRQYGRTRAEFPVDILDWGEEFTSSRKPKEYSYGEEGVQPYNPEGMVKSEIGERVQKFQKRTGEPISAHEAQFVNNYIGNVLGELGRNEKWFGDAVVNTINKIGLGKNLSLGEKPLQHMAGKTVETVMALKLGLWNMSSSLVNMSQLNLANGYLGSKWLGVGLKDSVRVLTKNAADYVRTRKSVASSGIMATKGKPLMTEVKTLEGVERKNLIDLVEELEIPVQQGLDSGLGESKFSPTSSMLNKSLFLFKKAELNNRIATGLGAYKRARAEGKPHLVGIQEGIKANDFVNFDYAVSNAPELLRNSGPIGPVLGQFKKYLVGLGTYMSKINKEVGAGKAARRFWIPYVAISGLYAIPGIEAIKNMINGLYGIDVELEAANALTKLGNDEELDKKLQSYGFPSKTNKQLAKMPWLGLFGGAVGVDATRRTGAGDLIPSKIRDLAGPALTSIWNFGGKFGTAVSHMKEDKEATGNWGSTVQRDNLRDWIQVVKSVATSPGNMLEAAFIENGKLYSPTNKNRLVMEGLTTADRAKMAIGFKPSKIAQTYLDSRASSYTDIKFNERRERDLATIQRAISQGEIPTGKFLIRAMAENGVTEKAMINAVFQGLINQKTRTGIKGRSPQALLNQIQERGVEALFDFGN